MKGRCVHHAGEDGTWLDMGNELHPSTETHRLANGREVLDPASAL